MSAVLGMLVDLGLILATFLICLVLLIVVAAILLIVLHFFAEWYTEARPNKKRQRRNARSGRQNGGATHVH